ncbi:MAG: acyl-CoA dehydrogenase [Rhodospirillales bacterium]|nr:acyl-CoA dehydrogenase [Rhodospirillales bacterium]MSP80661.1 acyl-CoA dehydrogenase [Rhodospirillales bacterium]
MDAPSAPEPLANHRQLLGLCAEALPAAEALLAAAKAALGGRVSAGGTLDSGALDKDQFALHGLAWLATYVEALRQMLAWARRLDSADKFGELEQLILAAAFGEYLSQMIGGIPLSQGETARPQDMGLGEREESAFFTPAVNALIRSGNTAATRIRIADLIADGPRFGALGLDDETLGLMREQFRRFAADRVAPFAHGWHLADELIPDALIAEMAALGVFGLTVPEEWGGLGLGKTAMCVVTEELSRGYIGVGSLGTRSEIAAELIRLGGTPEQKQKYLPGIASGAILPTAVFTEPNTGSDLASLRTRATRDGAGWRVTGAKTWITHAARSDLMTLLVRTNAADPGYGGLSMFLAEKPRGTNGNPFPAQGMNGSEIRVLGYRGMKEYEIAFDGFWVPAEGLLGGVEGQGFKQLMATFESARIQTAARAVGVAANALELGLDYARTRNQFGKPIYAFPRVSGKLAWMAVETMIARQLAWFAAGEKDRDRRCDIEAGMAKLLAARVAWSNADNALQIHGGNGYALEYQISRVLCDARILSIFEGAAEIQAHVVARGLLSRRN